MPFKPLTADEFLALLDFDDEDRTEMVERFNAWLERGDSIAVYENHDLGHPEVGHKVFFPFGPQSTVKEVDPHKSCPLELPGGRMHFRYYPHAIYQGPALVELQA